ncbi:MAG TPA: hypothetical protein VFD37_01270 [Solirubrobacterales bacterium]|nr:hypothetical protein [Solirubrobacterales bacterium]
MALDRFAPYFVGWSGPWNFAGPEETHDRLLRAGYEAVACNLEERQVEVADPRSYLEVVGLAAHLERVPAGDRAAFTDAVLARVATPNSLRYVRLNLAARKPPEQIGGAR